MVLVYGSAPPCGAGAGAGGTGMARGGGSETIHSGHFMVSHFEAEAQDEDEDGLVAPPPAPLPSGEPLLAIETSLNNLFQCMSLAYRQKLTSPKWNRFKGVRLRWKDKIRLNNVIWRCWHMQFIMKQNTLVCQFASPLDVDTHIKPETTLLEGKYWKRRAEAVKAEYKKWRMYYRNKTIGCSTQDVSDVISDMDVLDWHSQGDNAHMLVDEDYIAFMSDTLFSTISNNQPFAFPDTREIARGASLADFIQPSLGPLQPNLEDFMDTLEPLQDYISAKLPPVPEESVTADDSVYRNTFPQPLLGSNFPPQIEQPPTQYPISQMSSQHLQHLPHHQSVTHTEMHQPLTGGLQPISQNTTLENQQPAHSSTMLSRHGPSQNYLPQQSSSNSQLDLSTSVITQNQSQSMMLQPFNLINSNLIPHQSVTHTNSLISQQNVLPAAQDVQKTPHQYMPQQKMFHQIPVTNFHDRNYNMGQGSIHQSRIDSAFSSTTSRRNSGNGGYIRERVSRQRPSPFVPPPTSNFNQFNVSPTTPNPPQPIAEKPAYSNRCHEHNLISSVNTNVPQNISLTAGIYLSNISNQSDQGVGRFKMPSPPPQINNSTMIALPQASSNSSSSQQQLNKGENFRSNSLPLGASLGTMLGATRVRRRPRSGSSSPAPPRRTPLHTTASEPSLNPASVLLAHLLTSKPQEMYKPSSMQTLPSESSIGQQIQQVAILPAPTGPLLMPTSTSPQLSNYGSASPTSATSPLSPSSPQEGSGGVGKEHKRAGHIHAEQKRRYNIKNSFDLLQSLIPQLAQNPNAKVSKAAMLQKGAEYIKQLQNEMNQIKEETDNLKQQIECLNNSISNCQSLLPATGAPVSRQRSGRLKEMFDDYVCQRTNENWKFWIFSLLIEPLLVSFNSCVSPASTEELKRSTLLWAEQHCSLVEMRPAALNALKQVYTTTDIMSNPNRLPDEARAAVNKKKSRDPKSGSK